MNIGAWSCPCQDQYEVRHLGILTHYACPDCGRVKLPEGEAKTKAERERLRREINQWKIEQGYVSNGTGVLVPPDDE